MLDQSSVIFASLLIGFILFITNRGELDTYLSFLRGSGTQTPLANSSSGVSGGTPTPFGLNLGLGSSSNSGSINDNPLDISGTDTSVSGASNPLDDFDSGDF